MKEMTPSCAKCPYRWSKRLCNLEDGKGLGSCPTLHKRELLEESMRLYEDPEILKFAQNASILAVKDRLMGHNPLAAVYNLDSYYAFLSHTEKVLE